MLKIVQVSIFAVCSSLVWSASANQDQAPVTEGATSQAQATTADAPMKVEKPMKMDEPMQGGMKKKGMMKGDVKKSAEKKDKKMSEMLEKEEESMPPMPTHTE